MAESTVPSDIVPPAAPEMPSFEDSIATTTTSASATTTTASTETAAVTTTASTEAAAVTTTATTTATTATETVPTTTTTTTTTTATTTGVPETLIEKLIYWRDLKLSGAVFGTVTLLFILTAIVKYSFLAVFSFLLLVVMVGCFLYINGSKVLVGYIGEEKIPKPWFGIEPFSAEAIHAKVDQVVEALNDGIAMAHEILLCKDNMVTLKAIGVVFGMYIVGRIFPDLVLFYLIFLAVMTLPKIYEQNKEQIDATVEQTRVRVMEESEKTMKIVNERSAELRKTATKKLQETTTPLIAKMQPALDDAKARAAKAGIPIPGAATTSTTATATTTTAATTTTTTSTTAPTTTS